MSRTKGEGISVADAWNTALDTLGEVDDPEFPDIPTPVVVDDRLVDEALGDDDVEEPVSEEGPTKLSDLVKEDEQPKEDSDSSLDLNTVVELPNGDSKSIKELVDGYLRQSDYTQKTQTLADQRKELERASKLYDLMKEDTVGTIARLALEAGLIDEDQLRDARPSRAVERWFRGDTKAAPQQENIDEMVAKKVAEALGKDERMQRITQQDQTAIIIGELDAIERDYELTLDEDDRRAILQTALKERNNNLEHVFLKMQARLVKARASTQRVKDSATPRKGVRVPTKQVTGERPKDVREAFEWAVAQHQ